MRKYLSPTFILFIFFVTTSFIVSIKQSSRLNSGNISAFLNGKLPSTNQGWKTSSAFSSLQFDQPMYLKKIPGREDFLLSTKKGQIWLIEHGENYEKELLLDISDQVFTEGDAGFYEVAFHPDFANDTSANQGYIYALYSYLPPGLENPNEYNSYRLSRFYFDTSNREISRDSELVLIQHFDRHRWHNGGAVFFDKYGFLNFSMGDEGKGYRYQGQLIKNRLFGGILRIDVDMREEVSHPIRRFAQSPLDMPLDWPADINQHYYIPNDNPWVSEEIDWLEEYFIIGLRSPHTVYYDSLNDEVWVADVGDVGREEISVFKKGGNGQWPYMEGSAIGQLGKPDSVLGVETPPIHNYSRNTGWAVIGGFIYRGSKYPQLSGKYIFGDYISQDIWSLDPESREITYLTSTPSVEGNLGLVSFCDGQDGEIYVVQIYPSNTGSGSILRLTPPDASTIVAPNSLSELGVFENLDSLKPIPGVIPYELNSELYSDGATKLRWIAIPNDGNYNSFEEQIGFSETEDWTYPEGTVLIKHFELPTSKIDSGKSARLETRFFVVKEEGSYGLTYKWNEEGSDAFLINEAETQEFDVVQEDGTVLKQTWSYPSRSQCLTCHNSNAGSVLGLSTYNMNKDLTVAESKENQLISWNALGLFTQDLSEEYILDLPAMRGINDTNVTNESIVRSYIDVNCSFCHRPNGVDEATFDARFSVSLSEQNLLDNPTISRNSLSENFIIRPQDTVHSEMLRRVHSTEEFMMPPLGRSLVDDQFATVLKEWIMELSVPLSVDLSINAPFEIYPNPTSGEFVLDIPEQFNNMGRFHIQIVRLDGKTVHEGWYDLGQGEKVSSNIPSGFYLVSVATANRALGSKRLIVK